VGEPEQRVTVEQLHESLCSNEGDSC